MNEKVEISKKTIVPAYLQKTHSSNHIVNVVKTAISGIPIIEGPISSLVNDYIPNKKEDNAIT